MFLSHIHKNNVNCVWCSSFNTFIDTLAVVFQGRDSFVEENFQELPHWS